MAELITKESDLWRHIAWRLANRRFYEDETEVAEPRRPIGICILLWRLQSRTERDVYVKAYERLRTCFGRHKAYWWRKTDTEKREIAVGLLLGMALQEERAAARAAKRTA